MAVVEYGTVAIVPKGEYSDEIQYDVGNLVSYNGSSYVVRIKPPVGTLPTDKSYWQTSAQGAGKATANDLGVVKPDNETIGVESDGTLKGILTSELLPVTDTNGLVGQPNAVTNSQAIIDAITDKIMNKLVTDDALTAKLANYVAKSMMSGIQVNSGDKVPTSSLAYAMQQSITQNAEEIAQLNGDLQDYNNFYIEDNTENGWHVFTSKFQSLPSFRAFSFTLRRKASSSDIIYSGFGYKISNAYGSFILQEVGSSVLYRISGGNVVLVGKIATEPDLINNSKKRLSYIGKFASLSELEAALTSLFNSMETGDMNIFRFGTSSDFAPINGGVPCGFIFKGLNTYGVIQIVKYRESGAQLVFGSFINGLLKWGEITVNAINPQ